MTTRRGPALSHPAFVLAALVAAACVVTLVTTVIQDTDLWTLLAQGRAIWAGHAPTVNTWTWPDDGTPQVAASWLFRVLLWPLWAHAGVWGLFAWRWAAALGVFVVLFAAARRMGAHALLTLLVLVICTVTYRQRSDARPESLAGLLLAAAFWILETRRLGGPDRAWWLVPIALVWANAHVSFLLLFALLAFHAAGAWNARDRRGARRLAFVGLVALAACFVNPSGWRTLWQPVEFALFWRHDPMFASIEELRPMSWVADWRSGLPVLMTLWPVLAALRWRRRGADRVEILACVTFSVAAASSVRFSGPWVIVAAPFLARDASDLLPARGTTWGQAGAVVVTCLAISWLEAGQPWRPLGVAIETRNVPVRACDFMVAEGVGGRGFNHMQHGGYMAFRFWPNRARLPFVTTQPELSTAATRARYLEALRRPAGWYALDATRHFDYVLLEREQAPGDHLLDVLDMDSTWVMVFGDDAGELYVRRQGRFADLARRDAYEVVPGGRDSRVRLMQACERDTVLRARAAAEAERMAAESPYNGGANHLLGFFALMNGRPRDAARYLERTVAQQPEVPGLRRILGDLALEAGHSRDALRWYQEERRRFGATPQLDAAIALARSTPRR